MYTCRAMNTGQRTKGSNTYYHINRNTTSAISAAVQSRLAFLANALSTSSGLVHARGGICSKRIVDPPYTVMV